MAQSEQQATTSEMFKCSNCGRMYPTDGKDEKPCPVCGHVNKRGRDEIVYASNVGY